MIVKPICSLLDENFFCDVQLIIMHSAVHNRWVWLCMPCGVQLARHNKELAEQLSPTQMDSHGELQVDAALDYYATHTGQIEIVRSDRTLEQIVFPIPEICEYLTDETKHRVHISAERDDQNSKVTDFFSRTDSLFAEMKWQKKLRCE